MTNFRKKHRDHEVGSQELLRQRSQESKDLFRFSGTQLQRILVLTSALLRGMRQSGNALRKLITRRILKQSVCFAPLVIPSRQSFPNSAHKVGVLSATHSLQDPPKVSSLETVHYCYSNTPATDLLVVLGLLDRIRARFFNLLFVLPPSETWSSCGPNTGLRGQRLSSRSTGRSTAGETSGIIFVWGLSASFV